MIDLPRTCGTTASLICYALVMFMIYPWIKIKLKVLIFPIVITTASKAKLKPSVQTRFVLDAMESNIKKEEARLEQIQKVVYLLVVKFKAQDVVQQRMVAQLTLTTQAVIQSSKERLTLAQQLASTSKLVERLMADSSREDARDGGIVHNTATTVRRMEVQTCTPTV
jgi:hypothetical protein